MDGAPELGNGDVRKGLVGLLGTEHLQGARQFLEQLLAAWVCHQPLALISGESFVCSPVVPRYAGEELRRLDGLEPVRCCSSVVAMDPIVKLGKQVLDAIAVLKEQ